MKNLTLYYFRLRNAPLLVRVPVAISALVVAVALKVALRPVWVDLHLPVFLMGFFVTVLEMPFVFFLALPAFRGLPRSATASHKRATANHFDDSNPFAYTVTDEMDLVNRHDDLDNH